MQAAAAELAAALVERGIPLSVYPTGEIMLSERLVPDWAAGRWQSVGGHRQWLLIEMPHGVFIDLLPFAVAFRPQGVRVIVAHAERYPELLHDPALAERWLAAGCLIQVTAQALAEPQTGMDENALRLWAENGFLHLLGSDGHSVDRRPPHLAEGYKRLLKWVGRPAAERIGSHWGISILQGLPIKVPRPAKPKKSWFGRWFQG
jgi:protein-tyrosine phosphatase